MHSLQKEAQDSKESALVPMSVPDQDSLYRWLLHMNYFI